MITNESGTEKLVTNVKRVVRDSEQLVKDSAGAVGEKAHEVRERLADTLDSLKAVCRRLEDRAVEKAKDSDKVIREHPYQSIGVGFGIGLLIGVLVARK